MDEVAKPLDFWSFVDFAVERASQELPETDTDAMRLVLMLHRAVGMLVYDLESSVHRPRGLSWAGSACSSCCGSPGRRSRVGSRSCPG